MTTTTKAVSFRHMSDGTAEDYQFLGELEDQYIEDLPERLINALKELENSFSGYQVSRLDHSLQSATRAFDAGEPDEMIFAALLHDLGDGLAPLSHSEMAASIIRPYVSDRIYWIIKHHGIFQMYYYAHHLGKDRHARERFKDSPWYQDAIDFCEDYDQKCFDPEYKTKPLSFFEPIIRRVVNNPIVFDE